MFLFVLLPVLLLVGMILVVGTAILPVAVLAAVALLIFRAVARHSHPDDTVHSH